MNRVLGSRKTLLCGGASNNSAEKLSQVGKDATETLKTHALKLGLTSLWNEIEITTDFDFTKQFFYHEEICSIDQRNPSRCGFFEVPTLNESKLHSSILELCESQNDDRAKKV